MKVLTPGLAAKKLGISRGRLYQLLAENRIAGAFKVAGKNFFDEIKLDILPGKTKNGRPKKVK